MTTGIEQAKEVRDRFTIERAMWDDRDYMAGRSNERIIWHGRFVQAYDALSALVEEAKDREREIERLQAEALVDRAGWSTACVKCGQRYELQGGDAGVLAHVWDCEEHPLKLLVDALEEKCLDLDHEAQELLRNDDDGWDLGHASALHKSIDAVREVVDDVKRAATQEVNDEHSD